MKTHLKAVRQRLKDATLEGWQRQRLNVVEISLAQNSLSLPEIALRTGVHARTVSMWLAIVRSGGLQALLHRKPRGKGPASKLDETTAAELMAKLSEGIKWRGEEARDWLRERLGQDVALVTAYKYLGQCRARRPREHHTRPKAVVEINCAPRASPGPAEPLRDLLRAGAETLPNC